MSTGDSVGPNNTAFLFPTASAPATTAAAASAKMAEPAPARNAAPIAPASIPPPATGKVDEAAVNGTVFDETKFVAKKADNSVAMAATGRQVKWASVRFFVVAAITGLEFFYLQGRGNTTAAMAAGAVAALFLLLGIFGFRLNKTAFMIGMLIYGADTLYLAYVAWTGDAMMLVAYSIFVKCTIIQRLYAAYGMIREMEAA